MKIRFFCGSIVLFSERHRNHVCYFVMDAVMIFLLALGAQVWTTLFFIVNEVTIVCILICIEQLDEINMLRKAADSFKERREKVEKMHETASGNLEKVQKLHDLWNYRTMPFLTIMGKVHKALADKDQEYSRLLARTQEEMVEEKYPSRADWLAGANLSLQVLDEKLGPVSKWIDHGGEPLAEEWKETRGRQLKQAEQLQDVDYLIKVLPALTDESGRGLLLDGDSAEAASSSDQPSRLPFLSG